jgi:hypothetical protein
MNEFDVILEECVDLIASGESSLEECLSSYPEYAAQLEPILITLLSLQDEGRDVLPPLALRTRIRGELKQAMKNSPQEKSQPSLFFLAFDPGPGRAGFDTGHSQYSFRPEGNAW